MSAEAGRLTVALVERIADIAACDWDACCPSQANGVPDNPFISHAFLSACEDSGSAIAETGWLPRHLTVHDATGALVMVAPAYLKGHSQGEYVFDHGWADAFERAGGRYYPKLQVCVPFTPASGQRLLVRSGCDIEANRATALQALQQISDRLGLSSAHITFCTAEEALAAEQQSWLVRHGEQFHWQNDGYDRFEDFLDSLQARKRKLIRRERRDALSDAGISVHWLSGKDLTEAVWDDFFAFYMDTGSRKWGRPYLTRAFFSLVGERMGERIVLMIARRGGRAIAGAINFLGHDTLYGRHWGAIEDHPFLHFELCYYQAMEFAIQNRLKVVEAGAQGEHKVARGYRPVRTYSAHYLAHLGLRRAVERFVAEERAAIADDLRERAGSLPFNSRNRAPVDDE